MIIQISPDPKDYTESVSTLQFGLRVNKVEKQKPVKQVTSSTDFTGTKLNEIPITSSTIINTNLAASIVKENGVHVVKSIACTPPKSERDSYHKSELNDSRNVKKHLTVNIQLNSSRFKEDKENNRERQHHHSPSLSNSLNGTSNEEFSKSMNSSQKSIFKRMSSLHHIKSQEMQKVSIFQFFFI